MKRFIFMVTIIMSMAIMTGCDDNGETVNKNCTVFTLDEETGETIIEEEFIEEDFIEEIKIEEIKIEEIKIED